MSITKQGDKWKADIRPDGYKGKRYIRLFDRKAEALQFEKKLLAGKEQIEIVDNRKLNDLISIWYESHGKQLKSGLDTCNRLYAFARHIGNPSLMKVNASDFVLYRNKRLADGINPATLNRELTTLRALFAELNRMGIIDVENPFAKVRRIKVDQKELSFLSSEEINRLLDGVCQSKSLSLMVVVKICLATGARWSEAENIRRADLENGMIRFKETKNGKVRYVPISETLQKELQSVFSSIDCLTPCYGAFRSLMERVGIRPPPGQLAHILRHTFASHYLQNGGSIVALQKLLGHGSLNVTMRYAHLAPEYMADVVTKNPLANGKNVERQ